MGKRFKKPTYSLDKLAKRTKPKRRIQKAHNNPNTPNKK